MQFHRYLLRSYARRPVLGPLIVISEIFLFVNPVQTQIFYANNATNISAQTALTTSWIGPSITPLTNLNSGFRVYEVDSAVRRATYLGLARFFLAQIFTRHLKSSMHIRELHTTVTQVWMTARGTGGGVMYTYIPAWMRKPSLVPRISTSTVRVMPTARVSTGVRTTHWMRHGGIMSLNVRPTYYLHGSLLLIDSLYSVFRDASEPESCFGARILVSLSFAVDQLMFFFVEQTFTNFQGKQSVRTTPCNTTQCVNAKICYMRSGSSSIALQNCQSGFGSVQSWRLRTFHRNFAFSLFWSQPSRRVWVALWQWLNTVRVVSCICLVSVCTRYCHVE